MIRVLAIDPGEKCGWAAGTIFERGELRIDGWGIEHWKTMALAYLHQGEKYNALVYESYRIKPDKLRAHAGSSVPTLQAIGAFRLCAWEHRHQIVVQEPADKTTGRGAAKIHAPDIVPVIEAALAGRHDEGHHGDALMHLVHFYHVRFGGTPA